MMDLLGRISIDDYKSLLIKIKRHRKEEKAVKFKDT